jgi:type VI secretion system protein ImpL
LVLINGTSITLAYRGTWSLFRLLSQARLDSANATSVDLSFSASDGAMRYRVSAEKSHNPFTHALFEGFALPRTLLADLPRKGKAVAVVNAREANGRSASLKR